MAKTYKNIPVSPDTYQKVALLAETNGYGVRGLGAQIEAWVKKDMPDCGHDKQAVSIEYVSNQSLQRMTSGGLYCAVCDRVYAVEQVDLTESQVRSAAGKVGRGNNAFVPRVAKKEDATQRNIEKVVRAAKKKGSLGSGQMDVIRDSPVRMSRATKVG